MAAEKRRVSRYVAFLRGMNVGGHRLTNDELCAHFAAIGFEDVKSFRASGNVVFAGEGLGSGVRAVDAVRERIEQGLERALGYAVPTFIRDAAQLREIAAARPFEEAQLQASKGKLQVALLAGAPPAKARKEVLALSGEDDLLAFGKRELYWLPSGGVLDSPLDMKLLARELGAMTMRTKGTIEQIAGKHFADG